MKSPLLRKQGLDALLEALNDPEVAINDPRADKQFEHPYGSKGTEPETVKQGRWGIVEDLIGRPHPPEDLPKKQPSAENICPVCGGGLTRAYIEGGKSTEMICTRCKFLPGKRAGRKEYSELLKKVDASPLACRECGRPTKIRPEPFPDRRWNENAPDPLEDVWVATCPKGHQSFVSITLPEEKFSAAGKRAATTPKCPHCGASDYSLMPTDFETAKCNSCGKNWNHGIIEGINDPNTAAGWKSVLPIALSLGLGAPAAAPSIAPTRSQPPAVHEQQKAPKPRHDHHMDQLVKAISRAEGAKPERNNPGNIADFQTGKIKTFKTYEEGVSALKKQLDRIAEGKHPHIKPEMSLRDAGLIYSNGDPNWSKNISQIMHVPETTPIVHLIKGPGTKRSALKFATKNEPDPGQYDFKHEDHVRQEAGQWAQYAEESDNTSDIKPYDPEGNYLCGDCDMRQGENECMRVQGPISFTKGSCRLFHEGAPENKLPMKGKFTKAEAKYAESDQGGFGCHRCEYGGKAKEPDGEGRPSWCSFWGMHIDPMSCCSEQELVKIQPKSARQPMHDDSGATTGLRNRPDYGESDSYTSKANEANKTAMKHPLLRKKADVEMHETPTMLPPRDDMRRHLDESVQQEIDEGVDAPVQEGVKLGDSASHPAYDADQELRTELWLDDVADARSEARNSFENDPFMQQEAKDSGLGMEQLWEQYGTDYANEYWANRQGSKKAMKAEEGVSVCPKCNSSLVEEVTDNEGTDLRLLECKDCAHLFSL
jgi:hypothetical protein